MLGNFTVVCPRNIKIGRDCGINHGAFILGAQSVEIGDRVVISARVMILDSGLDVSKFQSTDFPPHINKPVVIQDGAWLGAGSIILPGVTIGRKSIVGAGSVVTSNVPPFSVVAGNPAKIIRRLHE